MWERPVNIELKIYSLLFQGTETGRKGSFFMEKKMSTFPGWRGIDMLGNRTDEITVKVLSNLEYLFWSRTLPIPFSNSFLLYFTLFFLLENLISLN